MHTSATAPPPSLDLPSEGQWRAFIAAMDLNWRGALPRQRQAAWQAALDWCAQRGGVRPAATEPSELQLKLQVYLRPDMPLDDQLGALEALPLLRGARRLSVARWSDPEGHAERGSLEVARPDRHAPAAELVSGRRAPDGLNTPPLQRWNDLYAALSELHSKPW